MHLLYNAGQDLGDQLTSVASNVISILTTVSFRTQHRCRQVDGVEWLKRET